MAYGKFRNGPTSLGRQAANWMQDDKLTWSTRRRGTVVARKSGEFTNIYQQPEQGLDGYYSLGLIDDLYKIVGSATARGTFGQRGDAGAGTWSLVPQLAFYGKGLGAVPQSSFVGVVANFDGKPCLEFHYEILTTRNGKALTPHISYPFFAGYNQAAARTQFHGGYWLKDGAVRKFALGYSGLTVTGGQQQPFYYWEIGTDSGVGAMLTLPNQLAIEPIMSHAGPGNIVSLHRFYRPDYLPTTIVNAANPGYVITYSTDGGRTWSTASAGDMFTDFDTFRTLMTDTVAHGTVWNNALAMMSMTLVPLSLTQSFAVCAVPYCELAGLPLEPVTKLKIKYGLCNAGAGYAINATGTLFDGDPADAPIVQVFGVPGGALMEVTPNDGGTWATPSTTQITADGSTFTAPAAMPFAPYQTGLLAAFDKKTLVCPMYDGEHSLYESMDWGVTWEKRATIYEGAPAPAPGSFVLQRFGAVTFLRDNDLPTNQTPATPWATDCKYTAPP